MTFDWTLDIGTALTIAGIIGGGLYLVSMMRADLRSMGTRMGSLELVVGRLADAMAEVAAQKERLDGHSNRLDRLERQVDGQ